VDIERMLSFDVRHSTFVVPRREPRTPNVRAA